MPHAAQDTIQVVFVATGNSLATRRLSEVKQVCSQGGLRPPVIVYAYKGAGEAIASALTAASKSMYVAVIFDDLDMPTAWLEFVQSEVARRDIGVLGFASVRPLSNGMIHDFGYELVRLPYGCATQAMGVGTNPTDVADEVIDCDVVGGCAIIVNRQLCGESDYIRRTNRWPELILCLKAKQSGLPVVALGRATFHEGSASKSTSVEDSSPSWLIERIAWDKEIAYLLDCEHLPLTPIEISGRVRRELKSARRCALVGAGVAAWSITDAASHEGIKARVFSGLTEEVGLRLGTLVVESMENFQCKGFDVVFDTTPLHAYDFPTSWNLQRTSIEAVAGSLLVDIV